MFDWTMIVDFLIKAIKEFGFPTVVAGWALWRLDKNWAKGENIQSRLDQIEEGIDRMEMHNTKMADIQQEMLVTLKILNSIITQKAYHGGDDK